MVFQRAPSLMGPQLPPATAHSLAQLSSLTLQRASWIASEKKLFEPKFLFPILLWGGIQSKTFHILDLSLLSPVPMEEKIKPTGSFKKTQDLEMCIKNFNAHIL